jgi:hypothetical protein
VEAFLGKFAIGEKFFEIDEDGEVFLRQNLVLMCKSVEMFEDDGVAFENIFVGKHP